MHYLLIIPKALWKSFFILNFVLGLIILFPFFYILLLKPKWYPIAFKLKRFWAKWTAISPGVFWSIDRKVENDKLPHPCVYCANHHSYLDIVMSYIVVPHYFIFMGKQEIEKAPLFKIFFKDMNILVDRKSKMSSHKAFVRAGKELEKGNSVFLFPEGGILSNKGILKNFKNGAFKLAIDHQVPIVPVTFLNNWKMLQNGGFFKAHGKPGLSKVIVHKPVQTVGMTEEDLVSLRTKVYEIIKNDLDNYSFKK